MNATLNVTLNPLPPLPTLALGHYRHYKGGDYEVLGVVRHSESLEPMVLYRPLYNPSGLWVRPYEMFIETVNVDGKPQPRFALVSTPLPQVKPTAFSRRAMADSIEGVPAATRLRP